jgi:hypothetical protein
VPDLKIVPRYVNPVQLYTLSSTAGSNRNPVTNAIIPAPLADKAAAFAACEADAACRLVTSDGYIIGAYHTPAQASQKEQQTDSEGDILQWQPMYYCTWDCCGTWVADGLIAELLQPLNKAANTPKLPKDSGGIAEELTLELSTTVCFGKPLPQIDGEEAPAPPGSLWCPKRCLTACCKQLASGNKYMGMFFFSQCSGGVCRLCGYHARGPGAASSASVLQRQYVRRRSRGVVADAPSVAATNARGVSNCSSDLC